MVAWLAKTVRMSAQRASTSWLMRTRCSWVSSQYASKRAVRSSTGSSRIVEGLADPSPGTTVGGGGGGGGGAVWDGRMSVVVVDGRRPMVVVDGRMSGQCHPGGRPRGQTWPNTLEAHPHPRVHCPSHTLLRVVVHPTYRALP